jgi:ABC-2 type transport system permease protein
VSTSRGTSTAGAASVTATGRLATPSVALVCWRRFRAELLQFRRTREAVFFTVLFPPVMLMLFGAIFHSQTIAGPQVEVSFGQYFVAGMIGAAIWGGCFQNLAISVPLERDTGALKRLAGTPMPRSAYFIGKIGLVLLLSIVECTLLIALGAAFYGLRLPPADRWFTFGWVLVLGVASCTLMGLGVAGLIRHGRSASAVVTPFAIILQFLSGVYFVYGDLPGWLQGVGAVFPLKWITQGMRSVFLPDEFRFVEPHHSWQHPLGAAVLGAWCVAGLVVALRTFRWTPTPGR